MKRAVLLFVLVAMVLITSLIWWSNSTDPGLIEWIGGLILIAVLGFAVYMGINRAKSAMRNEPIEDEMSKKILVKGSSLSYYISLYLWLVIMFLSDKIPLEGHTQIGMGILGMAIIFFLSWIGVKVFGFRNE